MFNLLKKINHKKNKVEFDPPYTLDENLIRIADGVISKNILDMERYLGIKKEGLFKCSMERLLVESIEGFVDDIQVDGLWNIRLFYNAMYNQASKCCVNLSMDVISVYKAIVAEIFLHEMVHVKQYSIFGASIVNADMDRFELEACTIANEYGMKGLYKI